MSEEGLLRVLTDIGLLAGELLAARRREALLERTNGELQTSSTAQLQELERARMRLAELGARLELLDPEGGE